jgi:small subunit ribosomal protein S8
MTDPISDLLTCIRNAHRALLPEVEVPHSKLKESIARILKQEGYIQDCSTEGQRPKKLRLRLKYQGREPVIVGLRRVSKPGLRHYTGTDKVPRVLGGLGTAILTTSHGVMTGVEARKRRVGGEVLCYVW